MTKRGFAMHFPDAHPRRSPARPSGRSLPAPSKARSLDPSGAVVPGVTVTLVNDPDRRHADQTDDRAGYYRFSALPAGLYTRQGRRCRASRPSSRSTIRLQVAETKTINSARGRGHVRRRSRSAPPRRSSRPRRAASRASSRRAR